MTDPYVDVDAIGRFEVTVSRDGDRIHTAQFADLAAAEAFIEEWSEMRPADQVTVDDRSPDHTGWELIEPDTAPVDDHEVPPTPRYDD